MLIFSTDYFFGAQYIVLTPPKDTSYAAHVAGAHETRLIGNPVKIRGCPAAVSENESRYSSTGHSRSGFSREARRV